MHSLVELIKISPGIVLDIRYATKNNFIGESVYPVPRCFLQKATAKRLHRVQTSLTKRSLGLKVFDGYRPLSVQKRFWAFLPDPRYIADPAIGSKHNRGSAVDLTLIDAQNQELVMPTQFDDMSERAHRDYQGCSSIEAQNRAILEEAMVAEGFIPFPTEWWHFDDPDWSSYPVMDIPFEQL